MFRHLIRDRLWLYVHTKYYHYDKVKCRDCKLAVIVRNQGKLAAYCPLANAFFDPNKERKCSDFVPLLPKERPRRYLEMKGLV